MISNIDALNLLENLDFVIIDEITELINNKRGDQLALTLSKLISVNKKVTLIGLSATIKDPIIENLKFLKLKKMVIEILKEEPVGLHNALNDMIYCKRIFFELRHKNLI